MSNVGEEEDERVGASCGKVGDIKSEADELHDRKLFTQPDSSHRGECPLCFLPMPIESEYSFWSCCSSLICQGCLYANFMNNLHDKMKATSCPFCREPANDDENDNRMMKRIKANDPVALREMGEEHYDEGDYDTAFQMLTKAAELGDLEAHYHLGKMYYEGDGVEKDEEMAVYHYEKAAIGGHPTARFYLAAIEGRNGGFDRSVKHFIIAAKLGHEQSMKGLWKHYSHGNITKEDLDATLRSHQAAMDAMKSAQRDAAEEVWGTESDSD
jgi:tetratricopeptide (TPR) repeat protein